MTKALNVGLIGYGFMGRAHSNAYAKVNHFFDLAYRPVRKAACGRDQKNTQAFADQWGGILKTVTGAPRATVTQLELFT